jgi:hypothetical protein
MSAALNEDLIEEWAERLQCADLVVDYPLEFEQDGRVYSGWVEQPEAQREAWRARARTAFRAGLVALQVPAPTVASVRTEWGVKVRSGEDSLMDYEETARRFAEVHDIPVRRREVLTTEWVDA